MLNLADEYLTDVMKYIMSGNSIANMYIRDKIPSWISLDL